MNKLQSTWIDDHEIPSEMFDRSSPTGSIVLPGDNFQLPAHYRLGEFMLIRGAEVNGVRPNRPKISSVSEEIRYRRRI